MHDPKVVAFDIRRPWPQRRHSHDNGHRYWPAMVTVWHNEPGGADAFTVCSQRDNWRWHVWHWSLQVPALQNLRRRLLTRCEWCGGRDRKGDPVCIGEWERTPGPWWKGERKMWHDDCSAIERAHHACVCSPAVGRWKHTFVGSGGWGLCATCGKYRVAAVESDADSPRDQANAILQAVPHGQRDPVATKLAGALWTAYKIRKGQL